MAESIMDGTQIDTSVFSYSAPKPNPSGGKVINLFNKHVKESLTISTPLILTWGAQEGKEQATGAPTGKWTLSLQFPSEEYSTPEEEQFLVSMKALEAKVKEDAMTYSKLWFGKEIKSADVIDEKFNPMLKYPKVSKGSSELDFTRPPTMTVKIPKWKTGWRTEIYNEDGEALYIPESLTQEHAKELKTQQEIDDAISMLNDGKAPINYLPKQSRVICLLQCGGLWYVNGKISITWNLQQVVVKNPKPNTKGICFIKPKESEKEQLKTMEHPVDENTFEEEVAVTTVDDSDEETDIKPSATEAEVEVEEEPITPAPVAEPTNAKKPRATKGKK